MAKLTEQRYLLAIAPLFALSSCGGPGLNLWNYATPAKDREAFDYLLDEANAAFNAGKSDEAVQHAEKAYALDPKSEEAAVTLGFAYLQKAGIDPFSLAQKMMAVQKEKEAEKEAASSEGASAEGSSASGSGGGLSAISSLLGLTDSDFAKLGRIDSSDPELPVILPNCAEDVRPIVESLSLANKAILVVCPFVNPTVLVEGEPRHACDSIEDGRVFQAKSHFLWAFTHLTEALAFQRVMSYATDSGDSKKSNLERRVEKVKSFDAADPANLSTFITQVSSLEQTVAAILPISPNCSDTAPTTQLRAMLNDLTAVNFAFLELPGTPKQMVDSITKLVEKIRSVSAQVAQSTAQADTQTSALKGQLTGGISKALKEKLNSLAPESISEQQKTEVCSAYQSITGGAADSANTPALCGGAPVEGAAPGGETPTLPTEIPAGQIPADIPVDLPVPT